MKFSFDECLDCGMDLTDAVPGEVKRLTDEHAIGTCPGCSRTYIMKEVTPEELGALEPVVASPEPAPELAPRSRSRRGRRDEPPPEPTAEVEPTEEPESSAEAAPE